MAKVPWEDAHFSFFANRQCEYFPCHPGADPDDFNCLFCYCPLYVLGRNCGGSPRFLESGVKDCTRCLFPHRRKNYPEIVARYAELLEAMKRLDAAGEKSRFRDAVSGEADGRADRDRTEEGGADA